MSKTFILANYLRATIADMAEVDLPALTQQAVEHFESDEEFVRQFFRENFYQRVYTIATQICATTRKDMVAHFETAQPPAPKEARPKWLARLEHAAGRYIRLADMDRATLKAAAAERRQRGETELHLSGLWEKLAAKMPEDKTVKEVYSDEEIDRWARLLKVQVKVSIPTPTKLHITQEAAD